MKRLTQAEKDELATFLEGLYVSGGYETQKEWAAEAGYHETNLSTAMNRATLDGMNASSLLRLIAAAAARASVTPQEMAIGGAQGTALARSKRIDRRLEELAAKVEGLPTAEDLQKAVRTLKGAIESLASRGISEARPEASSSSDG